MTTQSTALFSCLLEDLSPYLSKDDILLCRKTKLDIAFDTAFTRNASASLVNSFYAKYIESKTNESGELLAYEKFLKMNNHSENYRIEKNICTSWDDELYGEFKTLVNRLIIPGEAVIDYYHILSEARNGPGVAVGSHGEDSYTKLFSSRGAATSSFLHKYISYFFSSDHRWTSALNLRSSSYGDPEIVEGSKLCFVPKNKDIMRSICSEPSLNMFYQLGLGKILEQRLKAFTGIDLSCQPDKNKELTRLGSINNTFCTIDLASASDTISLSLLEGTLDKSIFDIIKRLRSPSTFYKGKKISLHMVSTMGNGFTFPLQTILFACAVLAVYRVYGIPVIHPFSDCVGNYGVFGDDIVVVKEAFRPLCRFLELLGFFVNTGKSFFEGPFRESCGADFFNGINIRGVYCKTLSSPQSRMVLVNRLNEFTARTGIPVPSTVGFLLKSFRFNPVPLSENDDSGIKIPHSMLRKIKLDKHVQSIRYDRWVAESSSLEVDLDNARIFTPRKQRPRLFNPEGLGLVFLQGGLRLSRIGLRQDSIRYRRRSGISPNWDFLPAGLGTKSPYQRTMLLPLQEAIMVNLLWLATPKN